MLVAAVRTNRGGVLRPVTLRWGGLNSGTRYHPPTRWHNHRSTRVTLSNCTINVVSVVSPIAGE
jgi:hypothetical protein